MGDPRAYISFRSPYSWMAYRRLEARGILSGGRVELIPFWEPNEAWQALLRARRREFLYVQMSKDKHMYIIQDVRRLAGQFGLRLTWPVDRDPDWSVPHLGYLAASRLGRAADFAGAVYEARWGRGQDVWSWEAMEEIAAQIGLDPGPFVERARGEEVAHEGLECLWAAIQDGVFGVPFFLYGREKYWGIDRLDQFLARLAAGGTSTAGAAVRGSPPNQGALLSSFIADHAGGCG